MKLFFLKAKTYKLKAFGFTLIELLVVIAIIGLLSSIVLASLSTARTKAKVAAAKEAMSGMRAEAELNAVDGTYPTNICDTTNQSGGAPLPDTPLFKFHQAVLDNGIAFDRCRCNRTSTTPAEWCNGANRPSAWAYSALLDPITPVYFCVDSTGKAKEGDGTSGSGSRASGGNCL